MNVLKKNLRTDLLGITSASLCVLHCLLMPVLLALSVHLEWLEMFCYLFIALGIYSVYFSTKNGTSTPIKTVMWLSSGVLFLAVLLEERVPWLSPLTYVAAAGLITGHILNIKCSKKHCFNNNH